MDRGSLKLFIESSFSEADKFALNLIQIGIPLWSNKFQWIKGIVSISVVCAGERS